MNLGDSRLGGGGSGCIKCCYFTNFFSLSSQQMRIAYEVWTQCDKTELLENQKYFYIVYTGVKITMLEKSKLAVLSWLIVGGSKIFQWVLPT